jgi:hypothetical protein
MLSSRAIQCTTTPSSALFVTGEPLRTTPLDQSKYVHDRDAEGAQDCLNDQNKPRLHRVGQGLWNQVGDPQ